MNIKNKINIFSREYEETLNLYKKMHVEGTEFDDAQNTFDGKSLKFFPPYKANYLFNKK